LYSKKIADSLLTLNGQHLKGPGPILFHAEVKVAHLLRERGRGSRWDIQVGDLNMPKLGGLGLASEQDPQG